MRVPLKWGSCCGKYRYGAKYLAPTFKSDCVSVMIWGAFSGFHKNPLVLMPPGRRKVTQFIDDVYERILSGLYFLHDDTDNVLLMEDGAPVHCAHISQQWGQAHGIRMLQWPTNSLYLNPIETVWKMLKDYQ
jgi:hypothetical protein